jgi:hypothetical protein
MTPLPTMVTSDNDSNSVSKASTVTKRSDGLKAESEPS